MSSTLSWRPGSVSASWASTAPPQRTLVEKSGIIASGVPYKRPRPPPTARPYSRVRRQSNARCQSAPLLDRRGAKWDVNGFGRIGRNVLRACLGDEALEFVAVNDITNAKTLAHLLAYDSVHGPLREQVRAEDDRLAVGGRTVRVLAERDPAKLPWKALGVELVLESSGLFTEREKAAKHIEAGAKKVIISAPSKNADLTICYGVNHTAYDPRSHHVVSNASCTTNCLAPLAKVLHETFGVRRGLMTTVHSYTNDQRILDLPHEDLRRARAAALSMIPTSTGAARAIGLVIPALNGKLDGMAVRVPTPNVSLVDLTAELEKPATEQTVNAAMREAANGPLKGILYYCEEPLVSADFNGTPYSSIFDSLLTRVIDKTFCKVLSWYDNEWGFSMRMRDVALLVGRSLA
ncbi:MAG: type I glyceraldehyde-3-phosphate dehydrogenase [Deltaproteobacteria bacterium]|nr:MAG: type I glyceraldehyde-3-phosphate dehydrogenase [Deltaproteobacteria bacterium]